MRELGRENRSKRQDLQLPGIAVIAPAYPARSETFVFREVHGLRDLGWPVTTVSLYDPPEPTEDVLGRNEPQALVVYGKSSWSNLGYSVLEAVAHPTRTIKTLLTAVRDAVWSRRESPRRRMLLVPQAIAAIGLASRLRKARVRMVHCHFAHAPTTVGMYAAIQLGAPFSFVGHANDLYQRRCLLETKLSRAAFVSCISTAHQSLYTRLVQRDASAYPIIRCGVDTQQFDDARSTTTESGSMHILTVCRLVEKKGVDTLIRALARLRKSGSGWKLTIAGTGPDETRLRCVAEQCSCRDAITWTGAIDIDRVRKLMAAADVFALPCREDRHGDRDGIPVVLMEAMASGLPVIAGDIASIRDLVQDDQTGLLVRGDDCNAVASALLRLQHDEAARSRMARNGRQRVVEEFSQCANIKRLDRAIRHALQMDQHEATQSLQPIGRVTPAVAFPRERVAVR